MYTDTVTKVLLGMVAVLLLANLLTGVFGSATAQAVPEPAGRGKYQISSWSAAIGTYGHHSGFYVIDTTTGRVVDSRDEIHDITSEIQKETQKKAPANGSVK